MSAWSLTVDESWLPTGDGPLFLRIARAISDDVKRGRLRAGDSLPGTRTLAAALGVHRNTVLAAYRELEAEGWVSTAEARGTFIAEGLPDRSPRRFSSSAAVAPAVVKKVGFDLVEPTSEQRSDELHAALARALPPTLPARGAARIPMSLGGGIPDVRLVPSAELARAMRRVLARHPLEVLSYGEPEGTLQLREALASMVSAMRGVAATADDVLVTRGSQMALDLVARTLLRPGDRVAVEAHGYRPAWSSLRASGAELVPVPVDARGLDVEALTKLAAEAPLRGVYVTPHHQYPTTVTLSPARRLALLELARENRMFVLEDDYDHEFHYEGRPVLPLASADVHGVVIYVGTLSKVLAPGLRTGFVVAPPPLVRRLAATRRTVDRHGDHVLERALAELLDEGEIQRHVRRAKRIYAERRAYLARLLQNELGDVLDVRLPNGGTAIWARVAGDVPLEAWVKGAAERGLVLQPARRFAFDGKSSPFLRLGFAQHDEREAIEAVRRMKAALPARASLSPSRETSPVAVSARSRARTTKVTPAARSSP